MYLECVSQILDMFFKNLLMMIFDIVNKQSKGCVDGMMAIKSCLTLHIFLRQKKQDKGFKNRAFSLSLHILY